MARGVNKVTLVGKVGQDPETRFTPGGLPVVNFSLATNESYNDKNTGQRVEQTEWHRITAFGKLAEIMQQYVKKGGSLYIEGKLKTNEWEKDGVKRYSTSIIANEMVMLDRAESNHQQSGYQQQPQGQPQKFQQQQQGQNQGQYQQQGQPQQYQQGQQGQQQSGSFNGGFDDIPY